MKPTVKFLRPCRDCDLLFRPKGNSGKYCPSCILKRKEKTLELLKEKWSKGREKYLIMPQNAKKQHLNNTHTQLKGSKATTIIKQK